MTKGRNCSLAYNLPLDWTKNKRIINEETIYVVGGLYGNKFALEKILQLADEERSKPKIIFNGDMHWFDVNTLDFLEIENSTADFEKLLGNVEFELFNDDDILGCGCNYPENVSDEVVERSNEIHKILKNNVRTEKILDDIKKREKTLVLNYYGKKIAITHGDEHSLSGWGCGREQLLDNSRIKYLEEWLITNKVNALITTHTCLPVVKKFLNSFLLNNGASGMANIKNETFGIFVRISKNRHKDALISIKDDDIYYELVKIDFDIEKFLKWFDIVWPINSPANLSYRERILKGTSLKIKDIML